MATLKELLGDAYKDGMTLEEIETALGSVTLPADQSGEIKRLNELISKRNGEIKDWKDKYNETLSADERAKKEREEEHEKLMKEVEELRKQQTISSHTASYVAMGYDPALAAETAQALVSGDMNTVFANQKKHQEALEKKVRAEALKKTPKPEGDGGKDTTMTLEKLRKMSPADRYEYAVKNPDEYKALYNPNDAGGNE